MVQHHKWSLETLENMLPWEREVYVQQLVDYIEEENEKIKNISTLIKFLYAEKYFSNY